MLLPAIGYIVSIWKDIGFIGGKIFGMFYPIQLANLLNLTSSELVFSPCSDDKISAFQISNFNQCNSCTTGI